MRKEDKYYQAVLELYRNVTDIYPPELTDIWVTGHSLGGALASLLGRTFGLPAVAFEAPGEMLATRRLHLPSPLDFHNIWKTFGTLETLLILYMGVCNGASSTCNLAGYAMETTCHTGLQCVYDVVTDKGWSVNLLNHRIHTVIDDIILTYNETAPCAPLPPCRDCFNWRFVAHDDNEKTNRNCPIHYEAAARVRCLLRQLHSSPVQLIVAVPHHQQSPRQHKHCPFPLPRQQIKTHQRNA